MKTILSNTLGNLMAPADFRARTIVADENYCLVSPGFVLSSILTDPVISSPATYVNDVFDCDDYVQYLKVKLSRYAAAQNLPAPLAVGYVFTEQHAFSLCLGAGPELFLINTQSDDHAVIKDPAAYATFLEYDQQTNPITSIYI